jgi:hypothetical protein
MKLIKLSKPSWILSNLTEEEIKKKLYSHLCEECRQGDLDYGDSSSPILPSSTLEEMLATACGCEFIVEDD